MTSEALNNEYFEWICNQVYNGRPYRKLLSYLHSREFEILLSMDENRASDGINLRYRFAYECGYSQALIAEHIDNRPASVLEVMVSLTLKCEEIMSDGVIGDQTVIWFWDMIESLGLTEMKDQRFQKERAEYIINSFLDRNYEPNGKGGLFTLRKSDRDIRLVELWYQMLWYLDERLWGKGV